jgi:hypothetical protein
MTVYRFRPLPDITAYELALLIEKTTFAGSNHVGVVFDSALSSTPLAPELHRHFVPTSDA